MRYKQTKEKLQKKNQCNRDVPLGENQQVGKPLAKLTKLQRRKIQINKDRGKKRNITTHTKETQEKRKCFKNLYYIKVKTLKEY